MKYTIEELKALCDAATDGEWGFIREKPRWGLRQEGEDTHYEIASFAGDEPDEICYVFSGSDCDFISAARTAIPDLIAELERVTAERDRLAGHSR